MTDLYRAVANQAARTPDRIAVEHAADRVSYKELMALSSQLAGELERDGIGRGDVVALAISPSVAAIAAVLGILESGAAYLPLDSAMPPARIAFMLDDSGAVGVVTGGRMPFPLPAGAPKVFAVRRDSSDVDGEPHLGDGGRPGPDPDDCAYVIYTSGSTGTPKGVAVSHGNAMNLIATMAERLKTSEHDRVLQTAALAFDASVEEIFASLTRGATLVICHAWVLASTPHLLEECDRAEVTVMNLPTPLLHTLVQDMADEPELALPSSVALIVTGGERLRPESARALLGRIDPDVRLLDMYGPTETTVTATMADVRRDWGWAGDDPLPSLGEPIPNVTIGVCDERLEPVPTGTKGELVVGGAGVAIGYVGHAATDASAFVDDPDNPGGRRYRTGDYVRLCEDGRLVFLGRKDDQVKVRGFRIEVGEVEARIAQIAGIREVAVITREDSAGHTELVACFTASGPRPAVFDLRAELARDLPAYMIPARWVALDAIPRLPSGKFDRAALADRSASPAPTGVAQDNATPLVRSISDIFAEVLDLTAVGPDDDFFHIGGHSLSAARVLTRVSARHEVDLAPDALTSWPTARQLAEALEVELGRSAA